MDADIHLRQVFKPHTDCVTALAYERDGEILATGVSSRFPFVSHWNFMVKFALFVAYLIMIYLVKFNF